MGRIHLGKQDLSNLQSRKMKGLKRGREEDGVPEEMLGIEGEEEAELEFESGEEDLDDEEDDSDDGGVEFIDEDAPSEDEEEADEKPKRQKVA
jgi:ribosome production factor 2